MAAFNDNLDLAKTQVALRALRYGHFPADIFDEYAWDMMLHMYIAGLRRQVMYIDNIVNLTLKSRSTDDRWIKHLQHEGLAEVNGDQVRLSEDAFDRMNVYHERSLELVEE